MQIKRNSIEARWTELNLYVDIRKKYKNFNLEIQFDNYKEKLGILGASGSGKSLTLKCIAGTETPDEGKIILEGKVLFDSYQKINLPPQERNVGMLFQNYALFPNMTVEENIGIGVKNKNDRQDITQRMIEMFHLEGKQKRYPYHLSGGEQQRVAMARILAYQPKVLMLDEPFSALDSYLKAQLQQELQEVLEQYNGTVIIVSHSRSELYRLCNRIAIVHSGKLIDLDTKEEIFRNPKNFVSAQLSGCKNISRAEKISDYEVYALDWNIVLKTLRFVEEEVQFVGIRAHDIRLGNPMENDRKVGSNNIPVSFAGFSEEPNENTILLESSYQKEGSDKIWWKVTKPYWNETLKKQIPRYIHLPEENILLLK